MLDGVLQRLREIAEMQKDMEWSDDRVRPALERLSEEIEKNDREIILLRRVFESARSVLRNNGIDPQRFEAAMQKLDDNCEFVKQFDSGTD
jgi:SMC interacting uncharacterized protein involved in chromosome segregation